MRNSSSLDWLRFMHTPNDYRVSHYLDMSTLASWDGQSTLTVKKKTSAQIVTAQTCKLTLTATDEWGVTHATTVTVVVNKFE